MCEHLCVCEFSAFPLSDLSQKAAQHSVRLCSSALKDISKIFFPYHFAKNSLRENFAEIFYRLSPEFRVVLLRNEFWQLRSVGSVDAEDSKIRLKFWSSPNFILDRKFQVIVFNVLSLRGNGSYFEPKVSGLSPRLVEVAFVSNQSHSTLWFVVIHHWYISGTLLVL